MEDLWPRTSETLREASSPHPPLPTVTVKRFTVGAGAGLEGGWMALVP